MKDKDDIQKYIDSISGSDLYDADSFVVNLDNFDGPLDLLWFLIRRSKIDVKDIFLSDITEQYLKSISDIGSLDLEKASDFIEISVDESDARLARLDWSDEEIRKMRDLMDETGIIFPSMCLSGHRRFPFGSKNPETRARAYEAAGWVDFANKYMRTDIGKAIDEA